MRPLRPATDHRLGKPLPHQLANRPQPPPPATLARPLIPTTCVIGMLCGISPGFPRLSPTRGQVSYVLLTRAPLYSSPCGDFLVRLACVRHAASVDSEPGSNSRLKLGSPAGLACERITCEFPLPVHFRREMIVPPAILMNQDLPAGQNVSLSIWTLILEGFGPIDVACSTQLSKSFVSRRRRGSPIGKGWKAYA